MKRTALIVVSALIIMTVLGLTCGFKPGAQNPDIKGTWSLDTYRYGGGDLPFISLGSARQEIKLITDNSFLWAKYDVFSKQIIESAGGKYTLKGNNYSESIDYGYGMDSYLGTVCNFKVEVVDGMLHLTGYLSSGLKIEEIWRKVE